MKEEMSLSEEGGANKKKGKVKTFFFLTFWSNRPRKRKIKTKNYFFFSFSSSPVPYIFNIPTNNSSSLVTNQFGHTTNSNTTQNFIPTGPQRIKNKLTFNSLQTNKLNIYFPLPPYKQQTSKKISITLMQRNQNRTTPLLNLQIRINKIQNIHFADGKPRRKQMRRKYVN